MRYISIFAIAVTMAVAIGGAMTFSAGGADYESSSPALGEPRRPDPAPRGGTNSVAAERLARASGEFGRRAV